MEELGMAGHCLMCAGGQEEGCDSASDSPSAGGIRCRPS